MTDRDAVARLAGSLIARLDALIGRQVNAILHHPAFQRLEAGWRGLRHLVNQVPEGSNIRILALPFSFVELKKDVRTAVQFDQSELFRKIYGPLDTPGDVPFGLILGDYEFTNHPDHLEVLEQAAGAAAAAFAPFIASAAPGLLDLKSFADLEKPLNLPRTFDQLSYVKWKSLRSMEDTRFLALVLPRVLMRLPYVDDSGRTDRFCFREDVSSPDRSGYLWGSAAFAYAGMLVRNFDEAGWLADIRGVRRGEIAAGLVTGLPAIGWRSDRAGVAPRPPTEVVVTDALDRVLGDLGFLPLCWCQDTHQAAFHGAQTLQLPKNYDREEAVANARLSAMMPYMLCASRFAHYVKVMMRDKVGSVTTPGAIEDYLNTWLQQYTNASEGSSPEMRARHPLREAKAEVSEVPGQPGKFACRVFLRPQFQLDNLMGFIELQTRQDMRSQ